MVRLGVLYHFSKERGFGLHGMINRGDVIKKYMRKLMEDEGYFSQVCSCRLMPRWTPSLGTSLSSSWYGRRTPSKGNECPAFRQLQRTAQKVGTDDPTFSSPLKARSEWPQAWPLVQVADAMVVLWVEAWESRRDVGLRDGRSQSAVATAVVWSSMSVTEPKGLTKAELSQHLIPEGTACL